MPHGVLNRDEEKEIRKQIVQSDVIEAVIGLGRHDIDIHAALCKLYSLFGIKRLMLEGGSIINGAFLKADAVDELSLVVAPVTADADDKPLFYGCASHPFTGASAKVMEGGAVWLRYLDKERFT